MVGRRGVSAGDIIVRLDLQQQIAWLHQLAFLDRQGDNFPADFRVNDNLHHGLNLAVGDDQFGQIAARGFFGLHTDDHFPFPKVGISAQTGDDQAQQRENDDLLACFAFRNCHFDYLLGHASRDFVSSIRSIIAISWRFNKAGSTASFTFGKWPALPSQSRSSGRCIRPKLRSHPKPLFPSTLR